MGYSNIERAFRKMGAEICIHERPFIQRRGFIPTAGYTFNIFSEKGREHYELHLHVSGIELQVLNLRPDLRHLLLMTCDPVSNVRKKKLLCGHDERHWFMAGVAQNTRTVSEAFETLKPPQVRELQLREGVRLKHLNSRHHGGFIRQGEWFFLPQPDLLVPKNAVIHRREPLRRGMGKPHMVEEIMRSAGELVYVCRRFPNGLTEAERASLYQRDSGARNLPWVAMRRNAMVYARGNVSHADHATLHLPFWHLVSMNGEVLSTGMAFLD
jgi:hypothetical protein